MEIVYNIIIPIFTSIIGGLIGGLFTFLGVKLTIKNDNELKIQERRERNRERNREIILNRPELKVAQEGNVIKCEVEIYVLPYLSPKLITKEEIYFDYDNLDLEKDFWDCRETIIFNSGKKAIGNSFLQLRYKSGVNIYSKYELFTDFEQMPWVKNYYSDMIDLPNWIYPNEYLKLKIYYPKEINKLQNIVFNCYMIDEDENYWYQEVVNFNIDGNKSIPVSPGEYFIHYKEDCNRWFIYDHLYYCKNVEKCFNTVGFEKILQQRKENLWKLEKENRNYKLGITNGEILLKS